MKVLVSGCMGHMGQILCKMISDDPELELTCGVDKNGEASNFKCFKSFDEVNINVDIIVDFSHHSLTKEMIDFATSKNLPLVIATTGQTDEEKKMINDAASSIPIFFAANYSMGIAVLIESTKKSQVSLKMRT